MHSLHCIPHEGPHFLSYLAFLLVSRSMFLKHDFLARVAFLFTTPHIPLPWLFLAFKIMLFCQYPCKFGPSFQLTSVPHRDASSNPNSADLQQSAAPVNTPKRCNGYGDGRQHLFTFEEVGTHIIGSVRFGSGPGDKWITRPDPCWQPGPDILGSHVSVTCIH
jgi:hypothetical protein